MRTMIHAAAAVLAVLLFAPMAYAYNCTQNGDEIHCRTTSSSEVSHGRLIVSNRVKFEVSFGYSVVVAQCRRPGPRVGKGRVQLRAYPASHTLRFRDESSEFNSLARKYGPNGPAICLDVFIDKCEQGAPSPGNTSCSDVVEARFGGLGPP